MIYRNLHVRELKPPFNWKNPLTDLPDIVDLPVIRDMFWKSILEVDDEGTTKYLVMDDRIIDGTITDLSTIPKEWLVVESPLKKVDYASFFTGWGQQFHIEVKDHTKIYDTSAIHPDLMVTKPKVNFNDLEARSLVTVNGLIHRTLSTDSSLFILGGGYDKVRKNSNNIGFITLPSSRTVYKDRIATGGISQISTDSYKDGIYIKYKSRPGCVVAMVFAGMLITLGRSLSIVNSDTLRLHIDMLPLKEWVSTFKDAMVEGVVDTKGIVEDAVLYSPDTLMRLMDTDKTFIVQITGSTIEVDKIPITRSHMPGIYTVTERPILPICSPMGNILEYVTKANINQWDIIVMDDRYRNFKYNTGVITDQWGTSKSVWYIDHHIQYLNILVS